MIPEDLIFDIDKLKAICDSVPAFEEDTNSKEKLKIVSDNTGYSYEGLISILTTSFVKRKDENYRIVVALLKSLIEK